MIRRERNRGFIPELDKEGLFLKPFEIPENAHLLQPYERMHSHQTLASARRYAHFKPYSDLIPRDELDFILDSQYNHSYEQFPDPLDVYLQYETVGKETWRRLRNTSDVKPNVEARASVPVIHYRNPDKPWFVTIPYKYNAAHPVIISGITERRHPSNVKLMNSSHHSPQTNAGYSRQDSDGTFYQY